MNYATYRAPMIQALEFLAALRRKGTFSGLIKCSYNRRRDMESWKMNKFYKKYPDLRNYSMEGKIKTAESHLYISNELWLFLFKLILLIPGAIIVTSIFKGEFVQFENLLNQYWYYIFFVFSLTAILAVIMHKKAMAIYREIEEGC